MALLALTGCLAPIGADQVSPRQAHRHLDRTALNSRHPSADSERVLNRYELGAAFRNDPDATLARLQGIACTDDRRDLLYALAELSYRNGDLQTRSVRPGVSRRARDSFLASAIYAYLYLFGEGREAQPNPFDIRFRTAGDFYNRGLARGLIVGTNAQVEIASGPRHPPPGVVAVQFTPPDMPWQITRLYSADKFILRGLSTRNRDSGLGAPLIAVSDEVGRFEDQRHAPVTVFLRVTGSVRDWSAGQMNATLELYSAFDATQVQVNGRPVPLQTDFTAPIAHGLNNSRLWNLGLAQFLSPDLQHKTGIRPVQPYTPGRVPVVFVHGTASSPVWWAEMWNTLRADPVIRERYQFWMFNYASGNPITISAGILRRELIHEVSTLDPQGQDPALQRMVIVGHSQGGLLAKLIATDTGDHLWRIASPTNLDALQIDEPTRELLRTNFFFQPLPCVSRVIFIATPHRGSYRNTQFVQRLVNRFMRISADLAAATAKLLLLEDTIKLPAAVRNGVPSSLSGMRTDNPFMLTLADIPVAPGIHANSIIAIRGNDEPPNGSDGVVKYTSAHVDYAESEFIVRSGHSAQVHPGTIEEVRRILLEDLGATKPAP